MSFIRINNNWNFKKTQLLPQLAVNDIVTYFLNRSNNAKINESLVGVDMIEIANSILIIETYFYMI